jgi:hypothetical protein
MLSVELKAFISTGLNSNEYPCIFILPNNLNIFNHTLHVGEEAAGQFAVLSATKLRDQAWIADHKPVLMQQIKFVIFKSTLRLKSQDT